MLFTLVSYFIAYCVGSVFCCCCIHSSSVFVNTFVSKRNEDFLYELNSNCKVPVMSYRGTVCVRMINIRLWFFCSASSSIGTAFFVASFTTVP